MGKPEAARAKLYFVLFNLSLVGWLFYFHLFQVKPPWAAAIAVVFSLSGCNLAAWVGWRIGVKRRKNRRAGTSSPISG